MHNDPSRKEFEDQFHSLLQGLTIEQLIWLNEMVIDYVKIKEDFDYKSTIRTFNRGDKVTWERDGITYHGWVVKTHKKTVNVAELDPPYRQWKIDVHFLTKEK